jgi:hypothetical protein
MPCAVGIFAFGRAVLVDYLCPAFRALCGMPNTEVSLPQAKVHSRDYDRELPVQAMS